MEVAEYRPDMAYRARTVLLEGDEPPLREVLVRFADGLLLVEEQERGARLPAVPGA